LEEFLKELALQPGLLEFTRVLIARLVGGQSGKPSGIPAFVALRGESKGPLIFEADGVVITLDIQPDHDGQVSILGQVAAEDQDAWTGAMVTIQQVNAAQLTASLDDLGAFRFEAVHPGLSRLTITSLSDVVIQSPDIDITV